MSQSGWTRRSIKIVVACFRGFHAIRHSVLKYVQSKRGWVALLFLAVAVTAGVWGLVYSWEWLQTGEAGRETGSTTVRNVGLLVAGVVALPLALWRSMVAQRQADAAQRQAVTAQQDLLNERYQRGAAMLGSKVLAVRLGGIYALERLAEEHPENYHIQNMRLLCAFVRHPTTDPDLEKSLATAEYPSLRQDVQTVLDVISPLHERQSDLERSADFRLDLAGANLAHAILWDADLSGAILSGADLTRAQFNNASLMWSMLGGARLCSATLFDTNLAYADLHGVDFSNASMHGSILSNARFSKFDGAIAATGLTQAQLDSAQAHPNYEPDLSGVLDVQTGEPLLWRDKSGEDNV